MKPFSQKMKTARYLQVAVCHLIFLSAGAQAGTDSFEPVEGYFSSYKFAHDYGTTVRNILLKNVTDTPMAMIVRTGSQIEPESALLIEEIELKDDVLNPIVKYVLTSLSCSDHLWNNKAPENVKVEKKTIEISKDLATAVGSLWFEALGMTKHPDENTRGLDDGATYFVSFRVGLGLRSGIAYFAKTPSEKSVPMNLIEIERKLGALFRSSSLASDQVALAVNVSQVFTALRKGELAGYPAKPAISSDSNQ